MDFTNADSQPDRELNELIWKSVKGPNSQMPTAVSILEVRLRLAQARQIATIKPFVEDGWRSWRVVAHSSFIRYSINEL